MTELEKVEKRTGKTQQKGGRGVDRRHTRPNPRVGVCCGVCVRCPKIRIEFNTKATRPNRDVVGVWGVLTLYVFSD